jgi:hypothetical protein
MGTSPRAALWEPLGELAGAVRSRQPDLHKDIMNLRERLDDDDVPHAVYAADARALADRAKDAGTQVNFVRNRASLLD